MTTIEEPKQFASEGGSHWYSLIDGSAVNVVPNKSKPGEFRPTTLRDAKQLGYLCPSVTEILKITHKPMLEQWKMREVVRCCVERPIIGGEEESEYTSMVLDASKQKAIEAANKGTDIHGIIETWLKGEGPTASASPYLQAAQTALLQWVVLTTHASPEKSFACAEGYGGKVDLHCNIAPFNRYVVDFKTKDDWEDPSTLGYDEHVMQLAAYANGLGMIREAQPWPRLISVFISRNVPGKWAVKEWDEEQGVVALKKFRLLLEYWFLDKGYRPSLPEDYAQVDPE